MEPLSWVGTFGGPMILLDQQLLPAWHSDSEDEDTALLNDYERACAVNGYLGIIVVGDGHALILNDLPLQTTWWPRPETVGGILVRWNYARNHEAVSAALHGMRDVGWEDTGVRLSVDSSRCIMFDAVLSGADVLTESTIVFGPYAGMKVGTYCAIFALAPCVYRIETAHFRPDDDTYLLLHRLIAV